MKIIPQSIRFKLFFWYISSLIVLAVYFFLAIHIFMIPYGNEIFILLFLFLGSIGFLLIYKITNPIKILTQKIQKINIKNLNERIEGINNKDEIGEFAYSFNDLLNRLEEAFKREQQFIADVAHELKTPIATIKSNIEITLSKNRNIKEYKESLHESLVDLDKISQTLTDVLDLPWSQTENFRNQYKKINLSILMEDVAEIATKLATQKEIKVLSKIEKDIYALGDAEKLLRAFLNLIDNAVKYSRRKDKITITLYKDKNDAVIEIRDTGIGISKKELPFIFDRFYRGSNSTEISGSGIGLALTKSIINAHYGFIAADIPCKGTIIKVQLPLIN